jgi:hypothetical protein
MTYDATTFNSEYAGYADTNCIIGGSSFKLTGTYTLGAAAAGVEGAKNLDLVVAKATLTPLSADVAKDMNANKLCGTTDWATGVEKSLSTACEGTGTAIVPGSTIFDIAKVSGNTLTTGDTSGANDSSTAAKRPTALDVGSYTKS